MTPVGEDILSPCITTWMDHTTIIQNAPPSGSTWPSLDPGQNCSEVWSQVDRNLKDGTPRGAAEQESMGKTVLNSSINALMLVEPMTCNSPCLQSSYFVNGPYLNHASHVAHLRSLPEPDYYIDQRDRTPQQTSHMSAMLQRRHGKC